jgi:hypothetical protein
MLDQSKYLPPKFSYALKDLAEVYGLYQETSPKQSEKSVEVRILIVN